MGDQINLTAILDSDISQMNFNEMKVYVKGIYVNNFSNADLIIPNNIGGSTVER